VWQPGRQVPESLPLSHRPRGDHHLLAMKREWGLTLNSIGFGARFSLLRRGGCVLSNPFRNTAIAIKLAFRILRLAALRCFVFCLPVYAKLGCLPQCRIPAEVYDEMPCLFSESPLLRLECPAFFFWLNK